MNEERAKRINENGTVGTAFAKLLNALVDMQASPAYAVRKGVLAEAEQTILALEKKANENAEAARKAELAQRPEARAQEPVAWAVYDEPTEELIDVTLVKPDGGEPGLRYEPLYMNCDGERK